MLVLIRGAGDLASGIALRLHHAHLSVVMTDLPQPTAIRRTVCFSQAIVYGSMTVEDVTAASAPHRRTPPSSWPRERSPFWPIRRQSAARPCARMSSSTPFWPRRISARASRTRLRHRRRSGFTRAKTPMPPWRLCAATRSAGRCITALPCRTRTFPALSAALPESACCAAPADGIFLQKLEIGASVRTGDIAGTVNGVPMLCQIDGMLRGILPDGTPVTRGMKSGDVDPRGKREYCDLVSDKALAIGGGVLEAILSLTGALRA